MVDQVFYAKDVVVWSIKIKRSVRANTQLKRMTRDVELASTERVYMHQDLHVSQTTIKTVKIKSIELSNNN